MGGGGGSEGGRGGERFREDFLGSSSVEVLCRGASHQLEVPSFSGSSSDYSSLPIGS